MLIRKVGFLGLVVFLLVASQVAAVDFKIHSIEVKRVDKTTWQIAPIYSGNVSIEDVDETGVVPFQYRIYVNGEPVATLEKHDHRPTPGVLCGGPGCSGSCKADILEEGEVVDRRPGTCAPDPDNDDICTCFFTPGASWPITVEARPGSEVAVEVDPEQLVRETDERNNRMSIILPLDPDQEGNRTRDKIH